MEKIAQHCYGHGHKTFQEFFKVFMQDTNFPQLRIPKSFTKFFNGITPCKVTLMDQDKNSWDICLEKIDGRLVFGNGWQQFAMEKCLEEKDFLVFEYDGKSTFYVKIFSKTGCRKEAENSGKFVPIVISDEDSDHSCRKIQRKRKHSPIGLKINEKSDSAGPSKGVWSRMRRTHEENGNHNEKTPASKNPNFEVHFSRWKSDKVEVPRRVLKRLKIKEMTQMNLRDENNNKSWPVAIISNNYGRLHFGEGWSEFCQGHNIEDGQRMDFQFVIGKSNLPQELLVRVNPPKRSESE